MRTTEIVESSHWYRSLHVVSSVDTCGNQGLVPTENKALPRWCGDLHVVLPSMIVRKVGMVPIEEQHSISLVCGFRCGTIISD
jgi:hypothetical protein